MYVPKLSTRFGLVVRGWSVMRVCAACILVLSLVPSLLAGAVPEQQDPPPEKPKAKLTVTMPDGTRVPIDEYRELSEEDKRRLAEHVAAQAAALGGGTPAMGIRYSRRVGQREFDAYALILRLSEAQRAGCEVLHRNYLEQYAAVCRPLEQKAWQVGEVRAAGYLAGQDPHAEIEAAGMLHNQLVDRQELLFESFLLGVAAYLADEQRSRIEMCRQHREIQRSSWMTSHYYPALKINLVDVLIEACRVERVDPVPMLMAVEDTMQSYLREVATLHERFRQSFDRWEDDIQMMFAGHLPMDRDLRLRVSAERADLEQEIHIKTIVAVQAMGDRLPADVFARFERAVMQRLYPRLTADRYRVAEIIRAAASPEDLPAPRDILSAYDASETQLKRDLMREIDALRHQVAARRASITFSEGHPGFPGITELDEQRLEAALLAIQQAAAALSEHGMSEAAQSLRESEPTLRRHHERLLSRLFYDGWPVVRFSKP